VLGLRPGVLGEKLVDELTATGGGGGGGGGGAACFFRLIVLADDTTLLREFAEPNRPELRDRFDRSENGEASGARELKSKTKFVTKPSTTSRVIQASREVYIRNV